MEYTVNKLGIEVPVIDNKIVARTATCGNFLGIGRKQVARFVRENPELFEEDFHYFKVQDGWTISLYLTKEGVNVLLSSHKNLWFNRALIKAIANYFKEQ